MRPTRRRRQAAVILLSLVCVALLGLVEFELEWSADEGQPIAAPAPAPSPVKSASPEPPSFKMAGIDSYRQVLERPVFLRSRRPPPEERRGNVAQLSSLSVVGLIVAPEGQRALVQYGEPPRLQRVVVGQAIEGWSVESILADRIIVRHDDREEELKLKHKAPPKTVPRRPAPPARN
jgi:hypothetical protein